MSAEPEVVDGEVVEAEQVPNVAALAVREPLSALIEPAADMATIGKAFVDYQELTKRLLNDSDYQSTGRDGGRFVKKSGWRKLAVAFGVTFEFRHKEVVFEDPVKGRGVLRAEFIFRATAPNGRFADGWGACSAFERCCNSPCRSPHRYHCPAAEGKDCPGFTHFSKSDHDIPATAETRAKNRAASDLFGMGQVSAEEVFGDVDEPSPRRRQQAPQSAGEAFDNAVPARGRKKSSEEPQRSRGAGTASASTPRGSSDLPIADRNGWQADPTVGQRTMEGQKATQQQLKKMGAIAGEFGWDDDERHRQAGIDSWSKLSKVEASWLIDQWEAYLPIWKAEQEEREAGEEAGSGGRSGTTSAAGGTSPASDLLKQAKDLYGGALLKKARLLDDTLRSTAEIPDHVLRHMIENNVD